MPAAAPPDDLVEATGYHRRNGERNELRQEPDGLARPSNE
jgi:hypothetical protein